eukprot:scaffold115660_cov45-Cyclotella_meneghiniana.AAC.2
MEDRGKAKPTMQSSLMLISDLEEEGDDPNPRAHNTINIPSLSQDTGKMRGSVAGSRRGHHHGPRASGLSLSRSHRVNDFCLGEVITERSQTIV